MCIAFSLAVFSVHACSLSSFKKSYDENDFNPIFHKLKLNINQLLKEDQSSTQGRITSSEHDVKVDDSIFVDLTANGYDFESSFGGAINVEKVFTFVTRSTFHSCDAVYGGSIVVFNGSSEVSKCKFNDNVAFDAIGVVWLMTSRDCRIVESNFTNNNGNESFGAIAINSTSAFINYCTFINNSALFGSDIGITNCENASIGFSTFSSATNSSCIHIEDTRYAIFDCCTFNNNIKTVFSIYGELRLIFKGRKNGSIYVSDSENQTMGILELEDLEKMLLQSWGYSQKRECSCHTPISKTLIPFIFLGILGTK